MTGNEAQGIIDGLDLNDDKQLDYMEVSNSGKLKFTLNSR